MHSVYVEVRGHLGESFLFLTTHVLESILRLWRLAGGPLPCRRLLLFSVTAFLSKKDERALLFLKFLLIYSLHFVYKQAIARVLSLVRQESLAVMLWGSLT